MRGKGKVFKAMDNIFGKPQPSKDLKEHTFSEDGAESVIVEYFSHNNLIASAQVYVEWFGEWVYVDLKSEKIENQMFLRELQEQLDTALDS